MSESVTVAVNTTTTDGVALGELLSVLSQPGARSVATIILFGTDVSVNIVVNAISLGLLKRCIMYPCDTVSLAFMAGYIASTSSRYGGTAVLVDLGATADQKDAALVPVLTATEQFAAALGPPKRVGKLRPFEEVAKSEAAKAEATHSGAPAAGLPGGLGAMMAQLMGNEEIMGGVMQAMENLGNNAKASPTKKKKKTADRARKEAKAVVDASTAAAAASAEPATPAAEPVA